MSRSSVVPTKHTWTGYRPRISRAISAKRSGRHALGLHVAPGWMVTSAAFDPWSRGRGVGSGPGRGPPHQRLDDGEVGLHLMERFGPVRRPAERPHVAREPVLEADGPPIHAPRGPGKEGEEQSPGVAPKLDDVGVPAGRDGAHLPETVSHALVLLLRTAESAGVIGQDPVQVRISLDQGLRPGPHERVDTGVRKGFAEPPEDRRRRDDVPQVIQLDDKEFRRLPPAERADEVHDRRDKGGKEEPEILHPAILTDAERTGKRQPGMA